MKYRASHSYSCSSPFVMIMVAIFGPSDDPACVDPSWGLDASPHAASDSGRREQAGPNSQCSWIFASEKFESPKVVVGHRVSVDSKQMQQKCILKLLVCLLWIVHPCQVTSALSRTHHDYHNWCLRFALKSLLASTSVKTSNCYVLTRMFGVIFQERRRSVNE